MGIMQSFRQKMPVVVIVLIVTFVVLMVLGDILSPGGGASPFSSGNTASAGEVNGEEISAAYYNGRVTEVIEQQRAANPEGVLDESQIREGIWQSIVDEMIIRQTADKLGIFVSDKELAEVFFYDPPAALKQEFTDSNGVFLQKQYFDFLSNIDGFLAGRPANEVARVKGAVKTFEENLRRDRLRQAVENIVTAPAMPSPAEARSAFDDQRAKASGSYVVIDATQISDSSIAISDADVSKYYEANKASFQQKTNREVRYALFSLAPSAQDSSVVSRRLKTITESLQRTVSPAARDSLFQAAIDQYGSGQYNGNDYTPLQNLSPELQNAIQGAQPGTVIGPVRLSDGTYLINVADIKDSGEAFVKVQHLLLRTTGTNDDSVKAQAEQLFQRAKSGEAFDALAQQYSADPSSAQRGGDMGYFGRGSMVKPFEDASFDNPVGSIVGPVKTDYGYHVIKVNDRSMKSYKLRDMKFDPRVSNITKNNVRARAQKFRDQILNGMPIDSAAVMEKVQVMESGPITRMQPTAGSTRLTSFAYGGKVGDISEVISMQDGSLIVGQISKVRNAGVMDLEDAKETIVAKLRTQKKLDMLKSKAASLRGQLAAGDSLTKLSTNDPSVQVRSFSDLSRTSPFPGVGFDYALVHAVFNQPLGQPSQPIRGERGYYIVMVNTRTQPTDQEFETERTKFVQQLNAQRRQAMFQDWLQKARERASIEDHRQQVNM